MQPDFGHWIECFPDATVIVDDAGAITVLNTQVEEMFGYRREEVLGQTIEILLPEQHRAAHLRHRSTYCRSPQRRPMGGGCELTGRRKDGSTFPVDVSLNPLRTETGTLTVCAIRDMSARKRDIAERQRAEEALEETEARLRQAQKMEAIGRLAGGIAHDINNLMTVVIGCGDLLLEELERDGEQWHLVKEMKDAGDRAVTMARQLLAFSRKQLLVTEVVRLDDIINRILPTLRRVIGSHITIDALHEELLGNVRVDVGQIDQVLLNLVINARDAMPDGGHLTIETSNEQLDARRVESRPEMVAGDYVRLTVMDTGVGMDAETIAHIFEPFFTTKGPGSGTGLGLATVYGIVKQSGGYIYVTSKAGLGTRFDMYFPRVLESAPERPGPGRGGPFRGSETILLVEDDTAVRRIVRSILEGGGYTVLEAVDGAEALRLYESDERHIDLLLTDAVMPHVNGRVLAQRLASRRPTIRVLFMSGYTEDDVLRHNVEVERYDFIQKPFTPAALARKVRQVLDEPRA
jgi:two-component system, cell cycle sensor histidine kinase and response regulator CckA